MRLTKRFLSQHNFSYFVMANSLNILEILSAKERCLETKVISTTHLLYIYKVIPFAIISGGNLFSPPFIKINTVAFSACFAFVLNQAKKRKIVTDIK